MPVYPDRSEHYCQLHQHSQDLTSAVEQFAAKALHRGHAVVVVACQERVHCLQQRLHLRGLASSTLARLLTVIDSTELLETFMRDGVPNRMRFRRSVEPILRAAIANGSGPPRVYGEMVNDLWHEGNAQAAINLEALWNELLAKYRFVLFCGYVLDAFDPRSYARDLEGICHCHAHVGMSPRDETVRLAIDQACKEILGFQVGSTLSQTQSARDEWDARLPLSRRSVLWLQKNASSRLLPVLNNAAEFYWINCPQPE